MWVFALLYSGLGDKDRAFEWLEKAYQERSPVFEYLEVEPFYDGLRSDPRVIDLLRRMSLADKSAKRDQGIHAVAVLPFKVRKRGEEKGEGREVRKRVPCSNGMNRNLRTVYAAVR